MPKLTYFLLVLVVGTIIFSAVRHPKPIPTATVTAIPLDELHQFASLTGVTEVDILQRVRNLIQKSANWKATYVSKSTYGSPILTIGFVGSCTPG